ncbi:MAG: hypothetical protein AABX51_05600 [Nanoarchaeota archaeon]
MTIDELVAEQTDLHDEMQGFLNNQRVSQYLTVLPVYEVKPNENYNFPDWYTLRFLRPVTVDTGKGLGWSEGLGGLNYIGTGKRFARSDWIYDTPDRIITHELRHDGELFHGHNLAEYWNRKMDALTTPSTKPVKEHEPRYTFPYVNLN